MARITAMILALALLAACGGSGGGSNPLQDDPEEETDGDTDPIDSDRTLPPGTESPSPNSTIVRIEAESEDGAGQAQNLAYDSDNDEFFVDNIPFDGDNTYSRGTAVSQLGDYAVYQSDAGSEFDYRAIYGVSTSGNTEFAIVRPTDFNQFGFRGYMYQRNGSVTLPTDITAVYTGDYAGVRVYQGVRALDYVTGDARVSIDFDDFNGAPGATLRVFNRRLFDVNGNDVTTAYLDDLMAANTDSVRPQSGGFDILPDIGPSIRTNGGDLNGEIANGVFTQLDNTDGTATSLSSGDYFAIVAGDDADEVVGILVMTGTDPRSNAGFEETGGFIVTR